MGNKVIKSSIYINGTIRTPKLVYPQKWSNLLDERLDEAYFSLTGVKDKNAFQVMDDVEYRITTTDKRRGTTQSWSKYYFVANPKSTQSPVFKGTYDHDLYCIELTKLLELYVVDSKTFTNALGRNYTTNSAGVSPTVSEVPESTANYAGDMWRHDIFISPTSTGMLEIPSLADVVDTSSGTADNVVSSNVTINVYQNGTLIYSYSTSVSASGLDTSGGTTINAALGTLEVQYSARWTDRSALVDINYQSQASYTIQTVENRYPLKRITCKDAIEILFDIATPLFKGEKPRFTLDPSIADELDRIYIPEITGTQNTLRENLQLIGQFIHGEPRLVPYGFKTYKLIFDKFGERVKSKLPPVYIERSEEQSINEYCSSIDSSAENLVNQLDYVSAPITVPRDNGSKTVRAETYVRVTDGNMQADVPTGISRVEKVECICNGLSDYVDITAYVWESTAYNSQLSSYDDVPPNNKAYALYYTIGGTSIQGLNFKLDDAWLPAYERYAIINILERESGVTLNTSGADFYPTIRFRITYVPYFNVRLTQSKPYIKDFREPATLIYNQAANVIENRAYGEHLKGVVARVGNPEKSVTYILGSPGQIPKAGELYDDEYYISSVAVEVYRSYIKCTLGLSKDFNRLSSYIGVSSERRLYEVSERAAYARTTVYKEYIVIGDSTESDNTLLGSNFMGAITQTFTQNGTFDRIDHVVAQGETYSNTMIPSPVELPVIGTALGNALVFTWNYEDNYSAGATVSYQTASVNGETVSGYFQDNYAYADYYGKIYYYHFDLRNASSEGTLDEALALPGTTKTPTDSGIFSTEAYQPYIYRKDSREISQFCAEVEFVTNRKDIIIGSALAARNPLIGAPQQDPVRLYFLPFKVNKFATKITTDLSDVPYIGTYAEGYMISGVPILTGTPQGSSTVTGTFQVARTGAITNAEGNKNNGNTVYKNFTLSNGMFVLTDPMPISDISVGGSFYTTDPSAAGGTDSASVIYEIVIQSIDDSTGDFYGFRYPISIETSTTPVIVVSSVGRQVCLAVQGAADCQAYAFITPQYTTTQTAEDDEGNVVKQTYYEGGEVLIASNTALSASDTISPIYFAPVHDPFKRFEIVETHGSPSMTGSAYKYARYDEGVKKFFCNESVDLQDLDIGDIVFYPTSYNGLETGKALAQVTIQGKSATSVTAKVDIIINKEEA